MNFLNSIFYKSLVALYRLNIDADGRTKNIIVDAIYEGLVIGRNGLDIAKLEMALETATDDWLDFWGNTYDVLRWNGESDDDYRIRIIEEITAPKNTIESIKQATARHLKRKNRNSTIEAKDVRVFEPWTELFKLDVRGYLDGRGRLISYEYWNYSVIDVSLPDSSLITPDLIRYLNKIKAGGVKITFTISPIWEVVTDPIREKRDKNIYQKIWQQLYIYAADQFDGFRLLIDGASSKLMDSGMGSRLDVSGRLDGMANIFWEGIKLTRQYYATGFIRNPLGSTLLDVTDYEYMSGKELTIEEAISMEEDSFNGTRVEEKKPVITLDAMTITTSMESLDNGSYVSYIIGNPSSELYYFDQSDIFDFISADDILAEVSNVTLGEIEEALADPTALNKNATTKAFQGLVRNLIDETNYRESEQRPMTITTTRI